MSVSSVPQFTAVMSRTCCRGPLSPCRMRAISPVMAHFLDSITPTASHESGARGSRGFTFVPVVHFAREIAYFEDAARFYVVGEVVEELRVHGGLGELLFRLEEFVHSGYEQEDPDDHQEVAVQGLVGHPGQDVHESHDSRCDITSLIAICVIAAMEII